VASVPDLARVLSMWPPVSSPVLSAWSWCQRATRGPVPSMCPPVSSRPRPELSPWSVAGVPDLAPVVSVSRPLHKPYFLQRRGFLPVAH